MAARPSPRSTHALAAIGLVWGVFSTPGVAQTGPPADARVSDEAQRGDVDAVRALVRSGADVNVAQGDGMSALHWAAERGDTAMVGILLQAGAGVRAVTRIGDLTPLHLAARAGHADVTRRLLARGAVVDAVTASGGGTALHYAALSGDAATVAMLLQHGADPNAREHRRGQTPLMFAAAGNRTMVAEVLLAHGADPSLASRVISLPDVQQADRTSKQIRDKVLQTFRETAGQNAPPGDAPSAVQAAIRAANRLHVAPREPTEDSVDLEEQQPTALSYAEMVGRQGGMTALTYAAREGHAATARVLLDGGADVNQVTAGDHTSPMLIATINGHFDLAMELFERGADPELASDAGSTPLYAALNTHWAPKARYPQPQAYHLQHHTYLDVMRRLLEAGVDPNVRLTKHLWYMGYTFDQLRVNTTGATPFWRAAYATDVDAMTLLITHGADPTIATAKVPSRRFGRAPRDGDQPDPSGLPPVPTGGPAVSPIHAASGVGYGEGFAGNAHRHVPDGWIPAVRYLVETLGADVNTPDLNGYTALHHAAARGDNELIMYLVERGADVTVVSRRGQTTVDMANGPVQRIQPFPSTIALLERLGAINNHNCVSCE